MDLFADMTGGWTAPCDGGLWWNKDHSYNGAIENELFLAVAASLATRAPLARRHFYLQWALKQWHWFKKTGKLISCQVLELQNSMFMKHSKGLEKSIRLKCEIRCLSEK